MDFESVATFLAQKGQPGFRSRQVEQAVTQGFAQSYDEITSLPLGLRAELTESVPLLDLSVEEVQRSQDGTIKVRFSARDGFPVEAVAMRHRNRRTVCVSSQSGCPLACTFCATGDMGLGRNLTSGEILEQVLVLARLLRDEDSAAVGNVVMMGMGEPFLNYDQVLTACRRINDPDGFGLGARSIAISTAGWVPGIERLAEEPLQVKLALSLHAPNDALRAELMPVTRRFPLEQLMQACAGYRERTRRRIFVEYLLLDGVNDSDELADELAGLLPAAGYHVNLIAYNPTGSEYVAADDASVRRFRGELERGGLGTSYRVSRGRGIEAACGQLVMQGIPARKRAS